ncbi:MAG: aldo/keto reductase [Clostridia bacterium]|nr:aldo/keto reductase [Clostridia bacterium]
MPQITLGRCGLKIEKNSFGCLPIQRVNQNQATYLLQKAVDGGMNFFDTARLYSDSEEKLGAAFSSLQRSKLIIATKSHKSSGEKMLKDLETSLKNLRIDYIDIYQFHNPSFCPLPGGEDGLYDAAKEAQRQGKIRFIGLTNHRFSVAQEALQSELYDTIQYPLSYLSHKKEQQFARDCAAKNIGFIAMKALAGGLITNTVAAAAFFTDYQKLAAIWGIQAQWQLEQFLAFIDNEPQLNKELLKAIKKDRSELSGNFCRSCAYCQPCPTGIEIHNAARMSLLLRRAPAADFLSAEWQKKMAKTLDCTNCGQCVRRCPYKLDIPHLIKENYCDYLTFIDQENNLSNS